MNILSPDQIALRIRRKRNEAGYTIEQLAKRAGISKGALSQWEGGGGGVKGYKAEHFLQLSRVLGVSPYWLMYGETPHKQQTIEESPAEYQIQISDRAKQVISNITDMAMNSSLSDKDMKFLQTAAQHIADIQSDRRYE